MTQIDIYARKSKVLAAGDRLREVSTDEQIKQGRAWAARNGYTVRKVWTELGSAYSERERPQFTGAIDAVVSGQTGILWVYMLDRFTRRGAEDVLRIIGKGRVIFDYDGLDSSDERDRERIIVEAERARSFSVRLSHRVRDVKASQRDAGEWVGGPVPWGLTMDPHTRKLSPDDTPAGGTSDRTRAQVVRDWVDALRAGVSAYQITRDTIADNIPGPRGDHWHTRSLLNIIRSPAVIGLQPITGPDKKSEPYRNEQGHTVKVGEGLVSPEKQREALEALRTKRGNTPPTRGKTRHLLTGILWCPGCMHSMPCVGHGYRCVSAGSLRKCPAPSFAGKQALETYVSEKWLHAVTSLEPSDPMALVIAERWAALKAPKQTAEHREALAALEAAETVRTRLQRAYRVGAYDGAEDLFAKEMRTATADVQAAKDAVNEHAAPSPDASFIDDPDTVREAWEAADLPTKRDLLRLAIDRIEVRQADRPWQRFDGDSRVTITWANVNSAE